MFIALQIDRNQCPLHEGVPVHATLAIYMPSGPASFICACGFDFLWTQQRQDSCNVATFTAAMQTFVNAGLQSIQGYTSSYMVLQHNACSTSHM